MQQVEQRQREAEAKQKDYIFHQTERTEQLDGHGSVKKLEVEEYDVFWLHGVVVRKLVRRDGRDLSADEQKKESERIDKEVAKARERRTKLESQGKASDANGHEELTVSRMLELGSFGNERRATINGRQTILVDFTGDPKAKVHDPVEGAVREMGGTIWVDESDRAIQRLQGRFLNNFKIGGGLLVNVKKDTSFELNQVKVNDEVWLPENLAASGQVRVLLLLNVNGRFQMKDSDYRKFKATSTILPGYTALEPEKGALGGAPPDGSKPVAGPPP
jgi:hypothetical protein